jgi:hypothetical protein
MSNIHKYYRNTVSSPLLAPLLERWVHYVPESQSGVDSCVQNFHIFGRNSNCKISSFESPFLMVETYWAETFPTKKILAKIISKKYGRNEIKYKNRPQAYVQFGFKLSYSYSPTNHFSRLAYFVLCRSWGQLQLELSRQLMNIVDAMSCQFLSSSWGQGCQIFLGK